MCSAYKLNKQGDNIQSSRTPFPVFNQSIVPCLVLNVASWNAYRFLWYSHLFKNFPQLLWFTESKALASLRKQSRCFSGTLACSMIQWMPAIWFPVPLPFLNSACTTRSLWFMHYWCLAWRIWNIIFSSVQLLSLVWLFATPWIAARQASLSITNS